MNDDRWKRTWDLFHQALQRPPSDRAAFLAAACGDDAGLRQEVEELLSSHREGERDSFEVAPTLADLPDLKEGDRIGPYSIVSVLGEGGMGIVYEALQHEPVRRPVALKLIRLGMDTREVIGRFEAERQTLAMMNHPTIARVFDAGATEQGRPFFAMEFVAGVPITEYCDTHRLPTNARLELFVQVCDGLQHAHQRGIIHRDIKPTNVLVTTQDGRPVPKIIDFGVAKATERTLVERTLFTARGQLIGTPEYMSPEQAAIGGLDIDTRTDVYALGVLLYELLAGALPFDPTELRRAGFDELRRRIREDEPSRPSTKVLSQGDSSGEIASRRQTDPPSLARQLRGDLDWITMKALEKDRTRRYASPAELAADINRFRNNEPIIARPPSAGYRIGKYIRRHKLRVTAASLILVALLAGVAVGAAGLIRALRAEQRLLDEVATANHVVTFLEGLFALSDPRASRGDSITAREILDRGVEKINELDDQPAMQSRLKMTMGSVYMRLGLYPQARRLLEEALSQRRALVDEDPQITLSTMESLGGLLFEVGDLEAADELFEEGLRFAREAFGVESRQAADMLSEMGQLKNRQGQYRIALELNERCLKIFERILDPDDPDLATVLYRLADGHSSLNNYDAALPLYQRALVIAEGNDAPDHALVGYIVNNLAIVNWKIKDFDTAQAMLERALSIFRKTYGPDHFYTASTMNNLGRLLMDKGDLDQARSLIESALHLHEKNLSPEHPEIATAMLNLASLLKRQGKYDAARPYYERGIAIREKVLGPDHADLESPLASYGEFLRLTGDESGAREVEARVKAIRERAAREAGRAAE